MKITQMVKKAIMLGKKCHIFNKLTGLIRLPVLLILYLPFGFMLITYIFVNMSILNICSWNATGLMSSAYYLSNLLDHESVDICGISEH